MIACTQNLRDSLSDWLKGKHYDKIFLLADANTHIHCFPFLQDLILEENTIVIPAGEENKNISTATVIWQNLADKYAGRNSLLINLGGGMITDLGGFAASVYQRGIDFIHIPTTLLAMVDASIGGKTGIDFHGLKNYIGTFQLPVKIFIYTPFLQSLSEEELLNGWAEVLKHGIIQGDPLWTSAEKMPLITDDKSWQKIVELNIDLKNSIVNSDPNENGLRKILNLGHTIGHAIETIKLRQTTPVKHGFCVAAGIIIETLIAKQMQISSTETCNKIIKYIQKYFPPISINEKEIEELYEIILSDKKNHNNTIRMSLPDEIGSIQYDIQVEKETIMQAIAQYVYYDTSSSSG